MMLRACDLHRHTVYHNELFQEWMQRQIGPLWINLPFHVVRNYAKRFSFFHLYSNRLTREQFLQGLSR